MPCPSVPCKGEKGTNLDERRHGKLFLSCQLFSFQQVRREGVKTHLDCYGSLADTSVAEDGYLKEHSYWGTLCGMKNVGVFSVYSLDAEETQSE